MPGAIQASIIRCDFAHTAHKYKLVACTSLLWDAKDTARKTCLSVLKTAKNTAKISFRLAFEFSFLYNEIILYWLFSSQE